MQQSSRNAYNCKVLFSLQSELLSHYKGRELSEAEMPEKHFRGSEWGVESCNFPYF